MLGRVVTLKTCCVAVSKTWLAVSKTWLAVSKTSTALLKKWLLICACSVFSFIMPAESWQKSKEQYQQHHWKNESKQRERDSDDSRQSGHNRGWSHDRDDDDDDDRREKRNSDDRWDREDRWDEDYEWDDDEGWEDWDDSPRPGDSGKWHGGRDRNREISVVQIQHMDFGYMSQGSRRCTLKSNTNLVGDCVGNGVLGEIEVKGKPHYAYRISVQSLGWIRNARLKPKLSHQDFYLDRRGKDMVYVGGTVRFRPGFNETGRIILTYQITVNYQ